MVVLLWRQLSRIPTRRRASKLLLDGLNSLSTCRTFCVPLDENHSEQALPSTVIKRVCFWVCDSYYSQEKKGSRAVLNLPIDSEFLTVEQAITAVAALADEAGSMVALSFFYWAIEFSKFRYCMRFYIISVSCFLKNGNTKRAHEVIRCMVSNFADIGSAKEAVDMVFQMQSQGLILNCYTLNCILGAINKLASVEMAENVFDEMCKRGVIPDFYSLKSMLLLYCNLGRVSDVDRLLNSMFSRGFLVDNAAFTSILSVFCNHGLVNRASRIFNKMVEMGLKPNVINYSCLINGLSRRGSIKQAFELLEKMVRLGLKPNVFTHTVLIDGLCKKGWTDKAFRLFLKLVRSDNYKPNVHTYTAMIDGYCKEGRLNRAEMMLVKMQEQGLVPNLNTYTALINGHVKVGDFDRAFELMDEIRISGLTPNTYTCNVVSDGLFRKGMIREAFSLLKTHGAPPDKATYTILVSNACRNGDFRRALGLVCVMIKGGFGLDIYTYTTLISHLSKQRKDNGMRECEAILQDALKAGLVPSTETYTSMISGYFRNGETPAALETFDSIRGDGDGFTYGAVISGLCREGMLDEAKGVFVEMIERGMVPCEVSRMSVAYEFCARGEVGVAVDLLGRVEKDEHWTRTVRSLIRRLCGEGEVDVAAELFDRLSDRRGGGGVDRATLTAFVTACYACNRYELVADTSRKCKKMRL
ncbi:hypothetical protein M569_13637 [Genlisea aurea]|uniref:Pentacotripeptide-repeat region of PRORP domain-containing protein n=1 Tax=Genlisea aurea TaxID=192259 RepID=S8C2X2_9LAMI|nr:hypothetical protein M569_13637 [Genlisea aurea]